MASSSFANNIPQIKYDVFLSFRGEDTRDKFTSHLYAALCRKQIETFIDNQLIRGDEISQSLLNAIEGSSISIIIFSEGYASSGWCLDELVKILECKNIYGQIVIPVFFCVDPSNVRNQTGAFGIAFSKLEERFKERIDKLQTWRIALRAAANLSGFDSQVIRSESVLIEKIVEDILKRLNDLCPNDLNRDLVGIESSIREIELLLNYGSIDVYTLGIWGIGGIGKTTLAAAIFNKISSHFDGSCFIQNIREESEKAGGLSHLRWELVSTLLHDGDVKTDIPNISLSFERKRLCRKKVLIVFDDVTHFQQIESLVGSLDWFKLGSLIMITTRNKQVLKNCGVKTIYEAKELVEADAVKLFSRYAFGQDHPNASYEQLSNKVMEYAKGVPLALKVLGCHLSGRRKEEWESAIRKLKRIPHMDIQRVLKISFNSLDDEEQNIFLDVACFFKGESRDLVIKFLDASGFSARIGISVLVDKGLIDISNNKITMHDLLQEMGREIVRQESVDDPGKRSRLWHAEDIYEVLTGNTGTKTIQGISLEMPKVEELSLSFRAFKKMRTLRFLKIYGENRCKIYDLGGAGSILPKLRYLHWNEYPLKSLPPNIHTENLVLLELPGSKVEQLWDGVQNLVNLKNIDLRYSTQLRKLPDLSKARNLEILGLESCSSLVETHSSLQHLNKLVCLNLRSCESLKSLPASIRSESLKKLILSNCSNLKRLPEISRNIEVLFSEGIAIKELASSISCLSKLDCLHLGDCKSLESVPSSIFNLKSLTRLNLSGCSNLKRIPEISSCNLKELNLEGTAIEELPSSIECLSMLVSLNIVNCSRLTQLPRSICSLKSLQELSISGCPNLQRLPDELGKLEALTILVAERTAVREIPSSIVCLTNLGQLYFSKVRGHEQMDLILPISVSLVGLQSLTYLKVTDCGMTELPESLGQLSLLEKLYLDGNNFQRMPESIRNLSNLESLGVSYCKMLQSLPKLPCSLYYIDASHCTSLESLSGLSILFEIRTSFDSYQRFILGNCFKLDQNELRKIVEDALQKIQLIATTWWNEQDQICELWRYKFGVGDYICYPGSEIPKWFNYQSMGSSITLELPQGDHQSKNKFSVVGFAFCIILTYGGHRDNDRNFAVSCEWKDKAKDSLWQVGETCYFDSDHIILGYKLVSMFGEYCYNDEAFIQFWVKERIRERNECGFFLYSLKECCAVVKKCGIRLLYALDFGESMKDHSTNEEEKPFPHTKRLKCTRS